MSFQEIKETKSLYDGQKNAKEMFVKSSPSDINEMLKRDCLAGYQAFPSTLAEFHLYGNPKELFIGDRTINLIYTKLEIGDEGYPNNYKVSIFYETRIGLIRKISAFLVLGLSTYLGSLISPIELVGVGVGFLVGLFGVRIILKTIPPSDESILVRDCERVVEAIRKYELAQSK